MVIDVSKVERLEGKIDLDNYTVKLGLILFMCTILLQISSASSSDNRHHNLPTRSSPITSSICRKCTIEQENEFYESGGLKLNLILSDPLRNIANEFDHYHRKLLDTVNNLLKSSEQGFHSMFTKTYGLLYEKHVSIFNNMFVVLNNYFNTANMDLEKEFQSFFTQLYREMFQELNPLYGFTEDYLRCTENYMNTLNVFGDIPKKLVIEVQRSFTAARILAQSLKTASGIINTVKEHSVTPNCQKFFIQMNYCQRCENSPVRLPCPSYCASVMSVCTLTYQKLNREWNPLLERFLGIINRLETSFNIESVVGPLDIKISEAIMNYQENGATISKKIFGLCGSPRIGKRRIQNRHPVESTSTSSAISSNLESLSLTKSPLDMLLGEMKVNLRGYTDFWIKLPEAICNSSIETQTFDHLSNVHANSKQCWNKSDATSQPLIDRGEPIIEKNEFISSQRTLLKNVISKLDAAFRGSEIPEDDLNGSGSGSGDGPDDQDSDSDDDDDYNENQEDPKSSTALPPIDDSSGSPTVANNDTSIGIDGTNITDNAIDTDQANYTAFKPSTQSAPAKSSKGSGSLVEKSMLLILTAVTFSTISVL